MEDIPSRPDSPRHVTFDEAVTVFTTDTALEPADEQTMELHSKISRVADRRVLPIVTWLYFLSYINAVNFSNIHTPLLKDLRLSEADFSVLVGVYFFGLVSFELPSAFMLRQKGTSPVVWLGTLGIIWGSLSLIMAFSANYWQLLILRTMMGCFHAGMFPGILYYLSFWYVESQRGLRFGIFFTATIFAAASAGFIAFIFLQLDGFLGLAGWRWVLLIEASPAVLTSFLVLRVLPASPDASSWLTEEESALYTEVRPVQPSRPLTVRVWRRALSTPLIWIYAALYLSLCIPHASVTFFLPILIENAGVTNPVFSNLITLPIFLLAVLTTVWGSKQAEGSVHRRLSTIISCASTGIVGYIGLMAVDIAGITAAFVSVLLCGVVTLGTLPLAPIVSTWISYDMQDANLLAIGSAVMVGTGNMAGIITPQIYAILPRFWMVHMFMVVSFLAVISLALLVGRIGSGTEYLRL